MTVGDYVISFVVVCLVLFAAWRGGQVNPTGTGRLGRRIGELELKVGEHGTRLDGIERSVLELARTTGETNTEIKAMRIETAGDRGVNTATNRMVERLQQFFMEDAFKRRDER